MINPRIVTLGQKDLRGIRDLTNPHGIAIFLVLRLVSQQSPLILGRHVCNIGATHDQPAQDCRHEYMEAGLTTYES